MHCRKKTESALIIELGPHLDAFVGRVVRHRSRGRRGAGETLALDPVHACKRLFVQRQAVRRYPDPSGFDGAALRQALEDRFGVALTEQVFAAAVEEWEKSADTEALDLALRYASWATLTPAGRAAHRGDTMFRVPHRIDPAASGSG